MHFIEQYQVESESRLPKEITEFGYLGGTFQKEEIDDALDNGYPLTLDIAIPGKCLNDCIYCGYYEVNSNNKLTYNEIKNIIVNFRILGGKSIKILGEGEPLLRKDIISILEDITKNGLIPVLFTSGDVLGDESLCKKIHGISNVQIIQKLNSLKCTIVLKYEAQGIKQDIIVNKSGYADKRDKALELLINHGFNKERMTRLGLGIVLLRENYSDVPKIFNYALQHNIYPLVCPLMPIGKMKSINERECLSPSKSEIKELKQNLCRCKEEVGYDPSDESDFPGGKPCDISRTGFYIDDTGNAYICESDDLIGNIRNLSLKEIWDRINNKKWEKYGDARKLGLCFPKRLASII